MPRRSKPLKAAPPPATKGRASRRRVKTVNDAIVRVAPPPTHVPTPAAAPKRSTTPKRVNVFNRSDKPKLKSEAAAPRRSSSRPRAYRRPPSLVEILATPWNGYVAASTFSGGGGSCLGYRWAGFDVRYANEFVREARETYSLNLASFVDPRDVREVRPEDVLARAGVDAGELDLFDGSPPCASFSMSGKREKGWGKVKEYSSTRQRVDDLFGEYCRLVEGIRPKVFVAENVSGLVKGAAKGYFREIKARLESLGYDVAARLLDAARLGVPQRRVRLFVMGVRRDLGVPPSYPSPFPWTATVRDAFDGVPPSERVWCLGYSVGKLWSGLKPGECHPKRINLSRLAWDEPSRTVTQTMGNADGKCKFAANVMHPDECRYPTIAELKRLCGFPDDYRFSGTFSQQWERMGRAVPPPMSFAVGLAVKSILDAASALSPRGAPR